MIGLSNRDVLGYNVWIQDMVEHKRRQDPCYRHTWFFFLRSAPMVLVTEESRLYYSPTYGDESVMVVEATDALLDELYRGKVNVKLNREGHAHLCGESESYRMRLVDNSNAQLYISPPVSGKSVIDCSATGVVSLERIHTVSLPDEAIRDIFAKNLGVPDIIPYLCHGTIWSEHRIRRHLAERVNYFMENGRWMMLSDEAVFATLDLILNICAIVGPSNGSEFNSEDIWLNLNESVTADGGQSVSLSLVQYLLSRLSSDESTSFKNKGETQWSLNIAVDPDKLLLHRGRQVLHTRLSNRANVNVDRFVSEWKQALETTVLIDACLIDDEALVNLLPTVLNGRAVTDDELIVAMDARDLSIEIEKRIVELFQVKPRWRKTEFESFIRPLIAEGVKPETVLLKTCRLDLPEGDDTGSEMLYSSKF